jgi:rod shape determining protein RodA
VLVHTHGRWVMGARRWLTIGPVNFQPSELAKIAVALALARWFHADAEKHKDGYGLLGLVVPIVITVVPAVLVLKQPDLGTALIICAVGFTQILFAGVRWKALAVLAVVAIGGATFAYPHLKPYQKKRVETFLNPQGDARGAGYHAAQSMIAVGSGQGLGKGWGQGTQSYLSFLPEQHTDFIFSVWAEEHGFVGCLLLLALYFALVTSAIDVAGSARDRFGSFLAVGIAGMLFWHAAINIGMVIGLLPVVGVTLSLMSYGGSSVLTMFLGIGLLANIGMRRFVN